MSKATKQRALKNPVVDSPVNVSRLQQVFGNLSFRRGPKLFADKVLSPVIVDAKSPAEANEKTNEALVEQVSKSEAN